MNSFASYSPNLDAFTRMGLLYDKTPDSLVRVIGTHSRFPRFFADDKLVFLERDPLDVMVSLFHHRASRGFTDGSIDDFVLSDRAVGDWVAFTNRWREFLRSKADGTILRLTYEDLTKQPLHTLARCVSFIGLPTDDDCLQATVANHKANLLRKREAVTGNYDFSASDLKSNPNAFHVRSARVGAYADELKAETISRLQAYIKANLDPSTPMGS